MATWDRKNGCKDFRTPFKTLEKALVDRFSKDLTPKCHDPFRANMRFISFLDLRSAKALSLFCDANAFFKICS
jgi:hypothetical protein